MYIFINIYIYAIDADADEFFLIFIVAFRQLGL